MSVFTTSHQRNNSAGEHLINNTDEIETTSPYSDTVTTEQQYNSMRYSAAATSDDCSSFYGSPYSNPNQNDEYTGCLCKDANLRANIRVIVGSILLTIIGIVLFIFGFLIMIIPNEIDIHGWIFCLVGVLFFIPGAYHLIYIICTIMGRPGYSFSNLSTFRIPPA